MDEYFKVSNCKNAKEMWDTLQVTHEGTTDVKRSRINTLTHEYDDAILPPKGIGYKTPRRLGQRCKRRP